MTPADWLIVNRVPIFRAMGEALTRSVLDHRIVRSYDRRELLFQQDDPATCCFLLLEGWVKLYRETVGATRSWSRCSRPARVSPRP